MKFKHLIIPTVFLFQVAGAQNGGASVTLSQETSTAPASAVTSTTDNSADATINTPYTESPQVLIMDYKSVYEAGTLEEEVKMAAERFDLTKSQQEMWSLAATDRRAVEKMAREKLDSKAANYERDNVYRGLRTSHNTFYEIVTGYLSPAQKQKMEDDRLILGEKQRRLAKLPPPPPPAPTVTVAPVDSSAIKAPEKGKTKSKKAKKKKTAAVG